MSPKINSCSFVTAKMHEADARCFLGSVPGKCEGLEETNTPEGIRTGDLRITRPAIFSWTTTRLRIF